jgi:hypothetical protein
VGRLDDIVARNKHPRRFRKMRFPVGLMLSAFVLLILVLMIFTDLAGTRPPASPPSGEKRVDGVILYREKAHRDGGAASGSAATGSAGSAQPR